MLISGPGNECTVSIGRERNLASPAFITAVYIFLLGPCFFYSLLTLMFFFLHFYDFGVSLALYLFYFDLIIFPRGLTLPPVITTSVFFFLAVKL